MNEKIVDSIVQLFQAGGSMAVWMYIVYVVGSVLKFAIGFGCVFAGICKISSAIREGFGGRKSDK